MNPFTGKYKKSSFISLRSIHSLMHSLGRDIFGLFLKKERTVSGEWAKAIKPRLLFINVFPRNRNFLNLTLGMSEKKQILSLGIHR